MRQFWVLPCLSLAACLDPSPANGVFACGAGDSCPTNYYCAADKTCWRNGSAGPVIDMAGSAALAIAPSPRDFGSIVAAAKSAAVRFTVTNNADVGTGT